MKATCSADALDVRIFAIGCLKPKSRETLNSNPLSSSVVAGAVTYKLDAGSLYRRQEEFVALKNAEPASHPQTMMR